MKRASTWVIACKEFKDTARGFWLLAGSCLFVLTSLSVIYGVAALGGDFTFRPLTSVMNSLLILDVFLIPLIAVLMAYDAFVGENGAGKTTLLRCLMGLYRSTGDIVIDGHNLNSDEAAAREVIAVVGDEGFFDENINLEKLGKYYGQMYVRFDMEKYLGYLERFNLDRKQKYKKLSKGMKIKAQLAFALSYGAKLFLFDEPTAGLDKHFREDFLRLCTELVSDGGKSIIISSHITEDLDRIADYIAYMQAGRLLFFKPKDAACEHFRIATGPVYKCKLIPKEAVVYMEEGTYSSTAMVIRDKCILVDRELQEHTPDIRELIHYLVKGGKENAENIVEKYFG